MWIWLVLVCLSMLFSVFCIRCSMCSVLGGFSYGRGGKFCMFYLSLSLFICRCLFRW